MSLTIEKWVGPSPEQWEMIIEGMRNPKNSWHLMDSHITYIEDPETLQRAPFEFFMGEEKDHDLAMRLAKGGPVHGKYRRMIPIWVTVRAPLFWWKEFDTYKVGTVRNSCSTMHKIHVKEFTIDDFAHEGCDEVVIAKNTMLCVVETLENLRNLFNETQEKKYWRAMIELLPDGYLMKATLFLNYEVLAAQRKWRANHKVVEWHTWCDWIDSLPYIELITAEYAKDMEVVNE